MNDSDNSEIRQTYPDSIKVMDDALSRFRGIAGELEVNRNRLYGLAIEHAVDNETGTTDETFRDYIRRMEVNDGN